MVLKQPLDLEYWFVNVFSGNWDIFSFIGVLMITSMAAYFKMNGVVYGMFLAMFALLLAYSGADALLIFPTPAFLNDPLDAKIIYSYHKEIAEASRAPIIVFQLGPIFGGVNYPTHALEKVLELPQVIGLKDASFDALRFSQTRDIVQSANHPITLLNGNDNFLLESFLLGAKGGLLGFGAVGVRLLVDMLNCVKNHKYEQAAAMQKKVQGFCDYIYEQPIGDYRARCKVALVHMGLFKKEHTYVRPPFLSLWAAEQNRAYQAVEQVGLLNCV